MTVISISITESPIQIVAGIPVTIALSTNIPANIFYTLDGTDPDVNSEIYLSPIKLSTNNPSVTLKAFATDGVNFSSIITQVFGSTLVGARNFYDSVSNLNTGPNQTQYPFGSNSPSGAPIFGDAAGDFVNSANNPVKIPDGYNGTGTNTPASYTNKPITEYEIVFSETDREGRIGNGIGTLPSTTTVIQPTPPPETSDANSPFFNPKALVIIQDNTKPPYDPNITQIMRPSFSLQNPETTRDGALLFTTALEGNVPSGSFLKSHYNPRDNTITYYYLDSSVGRWIISKAPYIPTANNVNNLSFMVFGRDKETNGFVFKWIPFQYRTLF